MLYALTQSGRVIMADFTQELQAMLLNKNNSDIFGSDIKSDSFDLSNFKFNANVGEDTIYNKKGSVLKVAKKDVLEMESVQLMDHYKVEGFWKRIFMAQGVKTMKNRF